MLKLITEQDLILPALVLLERNGKLTTTQLIDQLEKWLEPQGKDLDILKDRNDTKFSQKVRNLKSHDTLTKKGYATYDSRTGLYEITEVGKKYIEQKINELIKSSIK
ncbi:MAG: hypothetical protein N2Z71_00785 [Caloramator sp.]|nr:hypothetical protein [Caloramator sp.]